MLITYWADRPRSHTPEALGRFASQLSVPLSATRCRRPGAKCTHALRVLAVTAYYLGLAGRPS